MKDTIAAWDVASSKEDARLAIHPTGSVPADYHATGHATAQVVAGIIDSADGVPSGAVLDFGCGDGRVTIPLAKHYTNRDVIGADASDGMLKRLRARRDIVHTLKWDGLPGEGAPTGLAAVCAIAVLIHHMHADAARIIGGLASALQPGGLLILDLGLYDVGCEPESWTGVSTWTLPELKAVADRVGLDILHAPVSRGRFSYHALGAHHGEFIVMRRRASREEELRILAIVHMYPPEHNAGAEWMLHSILRFFVERGDQATVLYRGCGAPYSIDGVQVGAIEHNDLAEAARAHDVVVTHLDLTNVAMAAAEKAGRPIVHLVHNDVQLRHWRIRPDPQVLAVFNSAWIAAKDRHWRGERIVCRPHVRVADYETTPGAHVTLINLARMKGGRVFASIAAGMSERRFLGVRGAWGEQEEIALPNVEVLPQTTRIRDDVYRRTRILLMPSSYESWGRTAVEAACSGIPTIAAPTPGLQEALGPEGLFIDTSRPGDWMNAIRCLDDPVAYSCYSEAARARALELEALTFADLVALRDRLVQLCAA